MTKKEQIIKELVETIGIDPYKPIPWEQLYLQNVAELQQYDITVVDRYLQRPTLLNPMAMLSFESQTDPFLKYQSTKSLLEFTKVFGNHIGLEGDFTVKLKSIKDSTLGQMDPHTLNISHNLNLNSLKGVYYEWFRKEVTGNGNINNAINKLNDSMIHELGHRMSHVFTASEKIKAEELLETLQTLNKESNGIKFQDVIELATENVKKTSTFHANLYEGKYENRVAEILSNQIAEIGTANNPSEALSKLSAKELEAFTQGFGQDVVDEFRKMKEPLINPKELSKLYSIQDKQLVLTIDNSSLSKLTLKITADMLKGLGFLVSVGGVVYEVHNTIDSYKKGNKEGTVLHSLAVGGGIIAIAATSAPVVLTAGIVVGAAEISGTISDQEHFKEKILSSNHRIEIVNNLHALFNKQTNDVKVSGFGNNKETHATFNNRNGELYINNDNTGLTISDLSQMRHEDLQNFALTIMNTDFSLQIKRNDSVSSLGKVFADMLLKHEGNFNIINGELSKMNTHYHISPAKDNIELNHSDNHQEEIYHR